MYSYIGIQNSARGNCLGPFSVAEGQKAM